MEPVNLFRMLGLGGAAFSFSTREAGSGRALQVQVQPGLHNEILSLKTERQTSKQARILFMKWLKMDTYKRIDDVSIWSPAKKRHNFPVSPSAAWGGPLEQRFSTCGSQSIGVERSFYRGQKSDVLHIIYLHYGS